MRVFTRNARENSGPEDKRHANERIDRERIAEKEHT